MAIKPREQAKQKKQLTQRDDVLIVFAFSVAGGLHWAAKEYPSWATVLVPLSYVLGGIGVVMILSMLIANSKKRAAQRRRR